MNTTTGSQRHNKRQDAIWERAKALNPEKFSKGESAHIGRSWQYESTPIGQVTEQAKRDMDLIQSDVERKDWLSVINGVKYQVEAFSELLDHLRNLDAKGLL